MPTVHIKYLKPQKRIKVPISLGLGNWKGCCDKLVNKVSVKSFKKVSSRGCDDSTSDDSVTVGPPDLAMY